MEKAQEREAQKRRDMNVKNAQSVIAKVGPQVLALRGLLDQAAMKEMPLAVPEPLQQHLSKLCAWELACTAMVTTGQGSVPDIKEVVAFLASGKKHQTVACQMLATLAKVR